MPYVDIITEEHIYYLSPFYAARGSCRHRRCRTPSARAPRYCCCSRMATPLAAATPELFHCRRCAAAPPGRHAAAFWHSQYFHADDGAGRRFSPRPLYAATHRLFIRHCDADAGRCRRRRWLFVFRSLSAAAAEVFFFSYTYAAAARSAADEGSQCRWPSRRRRHCAASYYYWLIHINITNMPPHAMTDIFCFYLLRLLDISRHTTHMIMRE